MIQFDASSLMAAVRQTVDQVKNSVGEEQLRAVGFSGAQVFREEAKRNAQKHIQTGLLYRSIIAKRVEEESNPTRQVYLVTVRSRDAFYWRFVEYGHKFVPRNKRVSKKTGRTIGWAAHRRAAELEYGTASAPAYPFMRPAYDSKRQEVVEVMTKTLRDQSSASARTP